MEAGMEAGDPANPRQLLVTIPNSWVCPPHNEVEYLHIRQRGTTGVQVWSIPNSHTTAKPVKRRLIFLTANQRADVAVRCCNQESQLRPARPFLAPLTTCPPLMPATPPLRPATNRIESKFVLEQQHPSP
eukprot:361093-Chlamydomonas_euryale.AAC.1